MFLERGEHSKRAGAAAYYDYVFTPLFSHMIVRAILAEILAHRTLRA